MKIIAKDGSLSGMAIFSLVVIGFVLIFGTLEWLESYFLRVLGFSAGMAALAGAGYGGQAKALGLRSFGRSEWHSAQSSYKNKRGSRAAVSGKDSV